MKTPEDIFDDIYDHIKGSELESECTGILCEERPKGSTKEDITIVVFGTTGGQEQRASVNVNIFVHDIQVDGQWRRNKQRCRALTRIAAEVLKHQDQNKDYRFSLGQQSVAKSYEGKNEHIINTRLDYRSVQK